MIKKTIFVSGINLSGKILGLIKVVLLASIYGVSNTYDAYIVAYALPTILPQILTIIISTIFVPQYHKRKRNTKESWQGFNTLFTLTLTISITLSFILYIFAESIVGILVPGLEPLTSVQAVEFFKVMSVSALVVGISSFFISISNAREKFYLASLDSIIINIIVLLYCFIYFKDSEMSTILLIVISGFFLHLCVLVIANRDIVSKYLRLSLDYHHKDFLEPMSKAVPIIIGYVGAVSTSIVDQWFTSYEGIGSLSVLSYAVMLYLLPMEVFGKAVMETYYTKFSTSANNKEALKSSYIEGTKLIIFIMLPVSLYLLVSNTMLIEIIFQRGKFNEDDTQITSVVLSALSIGLIFRTITYFNYRLLHAINKSWLAVSIGLIGVVVNLLFNYLLSKEYGLIGIAFATTISTLGSFVLSCLILKRYYDIRFYQFLEFNLFKIFATSLFLLMLYNYFEANYYFEKCVQSTFCYTAYNVSLILLIPVLFVLIGYLIGIKEIRSLYVYFRSKINV